MILRSLCLVGAMCVAACSGPSQRSLMPMLRGAPSTDRPPWLRDLPAQLERYPAPHGWGGDHLAGWRRGGEAPVAALRDRPLRG